MSKAVYLIVPTDNIGGAEKRLLKIWIELRKRNNLDLNLVIRPKLLDHALKQPELSELASLHDYIDTKILTGDVLKDLKILKNYACKLSKRSVFHFLLLPPIRRSGRHRYIFSYPASSIGMHNVKGIASIAMGCLRADAIDVLSPSVFRRFRSIFFFSRGKFSVTPASFVDLAQYSSAPFSEKRNELVFLGLLSQEKQADRLLQCIPELHCSLTRKGIKDLSYRFMGRTTDQYDLGEIIATDPRFKGLPIEVGFDANPQVSLSKSKVFFSIQRTDNYPSKSLLEGIACGNQIIVTDVGATEMIAPRATSYYVPKDFTASDLLPICSEVLSMDEMQYEKRAQSNIAFVREQFSIETSLEYFRNLYSQDG